VPCSAREESPSGSTREPARDTDKVLTYILFIKKLKTALTFAGLVRY
jgi:hypothetical protein